MQILGISINNLTRKQILQKLEFILSEKNKKFYQIATVNPEFILQAQKDEEFKNIYIFIYHFVCNVRVFIT